MTTFGANSNTPHMRCIKGCGVFEHLPPNLLDDHFWGKLEYTAYAVCTGEDGSHSGKTYVHAVTAGSRQLKRKISETNDSVVFTRKSSKTDVSGRHMKYQEQESFIIQHVILQWKTGNPVSKSSSAHDLLIAQFGYESDSDRTEWELKIGIHSENITSALSQSVPTHWTQICFHATALLRQIM